MSDITASVRADLAPTGKLRAGVNYGNLISSGMAIDLLNDIAQRLGVPPEIVSYDYHIPMLADASNNVWDICFIGSAPQRAEEFGVDFTQAYFEIDTTYLVSGTSPFRAAAELDRKGIRIAANAEANYELFLRRNLKHAELVSAQGHDTVFDLLVTGKVDALAGVTHALFDLVEKLPGSRILDGRFMGVQQSIAIPKDHNAGLAYLRYVVEEAKKSGLVARAIERVGFKGISVAPI